jgi:hypothetical protein
MPTRERADEPADKLVEAAVDVGWQAEAAAAGDDAGQLVCGPGAGMLGCKPSVPSTCLYGNGRRMASR